MQQILEQKTTGGLTLENRKYINDLADIMKKSATAILDNTAKRWAVQYSKTGIGSAQDIYNMVRPGSEMQTLISNGYTTSNSSSSELSAIDEELARINAELGQ